MRKWLIMLGFGALLVFLVASRLVLLNTVPAITAHDEMVYVVQAKSYMVQGLSLLQDHRPWQLSPFDPLYAELPASIMALGFFFSHNPLVAAHLPSAMMGITLPFLLAWLSYGIWRDRKAAVAVGVLAVFNPLLWQFSRLGYDAFYSLWFYVLGGALLLTPKGKLKYLSIPVFIIGFFNYQGFKLLLVPWIAFLLAMRLAIEVGFSPSVQLIQPMIAWFRKHLGQILVLVGAFGLVALYAFVILPSQPGVKDRLGHTIFSQTELVVDEVNWQRRLALQSPVAAIFSNKALLVARFMLTRLSRAFDPSLLFLLIEPSVSGFSVWTHGIFYWVEGIWMALGVIALARKKKWRWPVVVMLVAVVGLCFPTLINSGSEWHLLRTSLSYTVLLLLAGWGLAFTLQQRWWKWPLLGLYAALIVNFTYTYFWLYPVISLDWGNFEERIVSNYARLVAEQNPDARIKVYVSQPNYYFWTHLVFADVITKNSVDEIANQMRTGAQGSANTFTIDNVTFTDVCTSDPDVDVVIAEKEFVACLLPEQKVFDVLSVDEQAKYEHLRQPSLRVAAALDSGVESSIYQDQLCGDQQLKSYISVKNWRDLRLEDLSREEFCQTWLVYQP